MPPYIYQRGQICCELRLCELTSHMEHPETISMSRVMFGLLGKFFFPQWAFWTKAFVHCFWRFPCKALKFTASQLIIWMYIYNDVSSLFMCLVAWPTIQRIQLNAFVGMTWSIDQKYWTDRPMFYGNISMRILVSIWQVGDLMLWDYFCCWFHLLNFNHQYLSIKER
jgi:hypothetical protein